MLKQQEQHFLRSPMIVIDDEDCKSQMAAMTTVRAIAHHYGDSIYRDGPFFMQFTDLHASNIFVDDEWNITCILDLEWICALPVEMITVPYWLTGCHINELRKENLEPYLSVGEDSLYALKQVDGEITKEHPVCISDIIGSGWRSNSGWFWRIMDSVGAVHAIMEDYLKGRFSATSTLKFTEMENVMSAFWREDYLR